MVTYPRSRYVLGYVIALLMVFAGILVGARPAFAQTETVLHNFGDGSVANDGTGPMSGLIQDTVSGNFFGTTASGGGGFGAVYSITPAGAVTIVYQFAGNPDGATPDAGLVEDSAGNFYGTTSAGGTNGFGTVFQINGSTENVLYSFQGPTASDGSTPLGGLAIDGNGDLFGTTSAGGLGFGTIFEIPCTAGVYGAEELLYSFTGGADAIEPAAGLIADGSGDLFGTSEIGGANGKGAIFELASGASTDTVLYSFKGGTTDGATPLAGLIMDGSGDLFGTTSAGGAHGFGTVFELASGASTDTLLASFAGGTADGATPLAGLTADFAGDLWGTTSAGGAKGNGTVFEIPLVTSAYGAEAPVYSFLAAPDGSTPVAGVTIVGGVIYGTTSVGGSAADGTVFSINPVGPSITSMSENTGLSGDTLTITGTNFTNVTSVNFGGVSADLYTVNSATSITVTVPSNGANGYVTVVTSGGTTAENPASAWTYGVPTITSFTPTSGPVGTTVTITGTNLIGLSALTIGGAEVPSWTRTGTTKLVTTVPTLAVTGPIIATTAGGSTTNSTPFQVIGTPTITNLSETNGNAGDTLTITGTNFANVSGVSINGVAATFTASVSPFTSLVATVPPGTAATGNVVVTTPVGTISSFPLTFTYNAPTITSFSPMTGGAGTPVTLNGNNLIGISGITFNGGTPITSGWTRTGITKIVVNAPANVTTGLIALTTGGGTATTPSNFVVVPTITKLSETSGNAGDSLTITGTYLTGATSVTFNGVAAVFTVTNATTISVTVPPGNNTGTPAGTGDGKVDVTTAGGTAIGPTFSYLAPTISSFTPNSGLVGTAVTITGTNLIGISGITFNGGTPVTSGWTRTGTTQIVVKVPAGTTTGPIAITTGGGTVATTTPFIFLSNPAISSISETTGNAGDTMTITGYFGNVTGVTINGVAATYKLVSTSTLTAVVPPAAKLSGKTGNVVVTVAGPKSTTSVQTFTYLTPTITGFSPTSGAVGTSVTITGTNLIGINSIAFGSGSTGFNWVRTGTTKIVVPVPAGSTTAVIKLYSGGQLAESIDNFVVIVPSPKPVLFGAAGNNSASLTWTTALNATSYDVWRGATSGGETLLVSGLTTLAYTDSTVTNGTAYYYEVIPAIGGVEEPTDVSNEVKVVPAPQPPTFVQAVASPELPAATTGSMSFTNPEKAGDMNIVTVQNDYLGTTLIPVTSVTDTQGNVYTAAVPAADDTGQAVEEAIYYAPNVAAGPDTVTVTFAAQVDYPGLYLNEFSGVSTLDKTAEISQASGSATITTPSVTTTAANEVIYFAQCSGPGGASYEPGFVNDVTDWNGDFSCYKIVSTTGSYFGQVTDNNGNHVVLELATFK